ncbi:hypothetical protein [Pyrococcus abyssi]|nr:hypothetical protein [Pyrococcus abyssi]CCE69914.1 TPA: hypothetical protein PAB2009 [Pyrococcus abyssi GE5]
MKILKLIIVLSLIGIVLVAGCIGQREETKIPSKHGVIEMRVKISEKGENRYLVNVTIRNVGNASLRVALPIQFITLKFKLYKDSRELEYRGPVPTYLPLTESQTRVLDPGESLSRSYIVDLCWWNITKAGTYQLAVSYVTKNVASEIDFLRTEITIMQNVTAKSCH